MATTDEIMLRPSLASEASTADQGLGVPETSTPLHLLPCCIEHNGQANVSTFFSVQTENADAKPAVLVSSFRGRRLRGASLEVPPAYRGVVLREQEGRSHGATLEGPKAEAEPEECGGQEPSTQRKGAGDEDGAGEGAQQATRWVEDGSFGGFTYWQHDTVPRDLDGPHKAVHWLSLAHQMHRPVTLGDVEEDLRKAA